MATSCFKTKRATNLIATPTTPCLDPKCEVLQLLFEICRTFFAILHSVHHLYFEKREECLVAV